jgi:hypothetical protein
MLKKSILTGITVVLTLALSIPVHSQVEVDLETGAVFSGYNDVRIPGKGGILFSLSEELTADPAFYYRIRLFYDFNPRHHLGVLIAPLTIRSSGHLDRDLIFEGETFPANVPLEATYKFNSYRLIYRYDFLRNEKVEFGVGATAKIRDARIAVKGTDVESDKSNVGLVPLVHFRLLWKLDKTFSFLLDGDALAAPQGRAEDVLAVLRIWVSDRFDLKFGYRILEGGADNDEVYTFALIHYASIGTIIHF